ncbi:unnamed protein product [Trifolium pratense]|uniref:Uncharacterized protein n=1 Tax=Trifolium pratense TaxID=57577 RepID=A0ACB0LZ67_TRIPR|nr:unnamed protein product [Trifolium pratense]
MKFTKAISNPLLTYIMAPNICDVLSEIKRIIKSQHSHYLALYAIFLLPLNFFSLIFQLLLKHFQQQQPPPNPTIIISLSLLLIIFSTIFTYGAIISITYSVFHGFFNRQVKLNEAIKSISTSFFPLLATNIVMFTVIFFVSFLILFLILLLSFLTLLLDDVHATLYSYLNSLSYMVLMLSFLSFVTYLAINFSFVHVIVVVESCWGFEPLRRSWKLVKGMKWLILTIIFLFGSFPILVSMSGYNNWVLIFVSSPIVAMFSLYNIAAITVVYIYSKEKHGVVANEGFGKEKDGAHLPLIP